MVLPILARGFIGVTMYGVCRKIPYIWSGEIREYDPRKENYRVRPMTPVEKVSICALGVPLVFLFLPIWIKYDIQMCMYKLHGQYPLDHGYNVGAKHIIEHTID